MNDGSKAVGGKARQTAPRPHIEESLSGQGILSEHFLQRMFSLMNLTIRERLRKTAPVLSERESSTGCNIRSVFDCRGVLKGCLHG